jgi:Protein of unknown function (DUF1488)
MAKGYIVDAESRCVKFVIPAARRHIRCIISFETLAQSFEATLPLQAESVFMRNRAAIERVAQRLISGGRPDDGDGWMWIRPADC